MTSLISPPVGDIADLLLDAVCMVDAGGRFVYVSAACERIFGYTQREMIGRIMIDMVAPADRERTLLAAQAVMSGHSHVNFENRYVRKDGTLVDIMWSASWSETYQLRVGVARDITAVKQAQAVQAALYAISDAAHTSTDLATLYQRSHEMIADLLPVSGFVIALYDLGETAGRTLRIAYQMDNGAPQTTLASVLCDEAIRHSTPIMLEAGKSATLSGPLRDVAEHMTGCAFAVPLVASQETVGVLALYNDASPGYSEQDRNLLLFLADQLASAIGRQRLLVQLQFMAMHDDLTGLPNRRLFYDRLDSAISRARRQQTRLSLLFIDVNRFKQVNDQYGHACGDMLLKQVANRINACLRDSDTLARLGGDEFVVLLENIALTIDAELVADKIHLSLASPFDLGMTVLNVFVSIGVAHFPDHGNQREALLSHADNAMYMAKAQAALATG